MNQDECTHTGSNQGATPETILSGLALMSQATIKRNNKVPVKAASQTPSQAALERGASIGLRSLRVALTIFSQLWSGASILIEASGVPERT
jgi:hypothetical protein